MSESGKFLGLLERGASRRYEAERPSIWQVKGQSKIMDIEMQELLLVTS